MSYQTPDGFLMRSHSDPAEGPMLDGQPGAICTICGAYVHPPLTTKHRATCPLPEETPMTDLDPAAALAAAAADGVTIAPRPAPAATFAQLALKAVEVWVLAGPAKAALKHDLRHEWPDLWHALEAMAQFDGATPYTPAPAAVSDLGRPRHEEGLYALTKLAKDLPEGPGRDLARGVIRRPYRAALAAVLIAAQLGSRSSWSGADELQDIGGTLGDAGLALGDEALWRPIADQFGIEHDDEVEG